MSLPLSNSTLSVSVVVVELQATVILFKLKLILVLGSVGSSSFVSVGWILFGSSVTWFYSGLKNITSLIKQILTFYL